MDRFRFQKILFVATLGIAGVVAAADPVTITVEPSITRKIGGVAALERNRYFCVSDPGAHFDERMAAGAGVYEYLVHELGISFGRSLGPIKYIAKGLPENPKRPGFADLSSLRKKKLKEPTGIFRSDFGQNLDVAAHGNHNAYPDYMGKHFRGASNHHGEPEWLPENIAAAAELAAAVLKYNYTDFDRPKYYEPLDEPAWEFFTDPHLADWHLKVMEMVHEQTPEVQVGGLCMSVSHFYCGNYSHFKGMKSFIDYTDGKMDFYSFHSYDYFNWEKDDFCGRVQSGLPLEGSLDLLENYTVNRAGREVDVVVSEHGGYINAEEPGLYVGEAVAAQIAEKYFPNDAPWEKEMKKRSVVAFMHVSSILANTMAFMDHPHTVQKAVPFLLPDTWGWDPVYYASLFVPDNYTDKSKWVKTHMLDFYRFFRGVNGRRIKATCADPDLQTRAFVGGSKLYLAINNQNGNPETISLKGIDSAQVELRRFGRNHDFTAYFTEESVPTPDQLVVAGREAVMIVADFGRPIEATEIVNEVICYADKVMMPVKKADFEIKVPVKKPIDYATMRIGFTRRPESSRQPVVLMNGHPLDVPMEDCADRLSDNEYATTKLIPLDVNLLQSTNQVSVRFDDGDDGMIGSVVIRAAVKH